jgi:hypothetical protein
MPTKTFMVELELTDSQVRNICSKVPEDRPDTYKLEGVAKQAMLDIGDGGFVVEGKVAEQIMALTGPMESTQDLVGFVEKGMGRRDGSIEVTWNPDPTYVPVLEEAARSQGISVQELAQGLMDMGTSQGWCYAINPEVKILFLSREDNRFMAEVLDQKPEYITGTSIADFIRRSVEVPDLEMTGKAGK